MKQFDLKILLPDKQSPDLMERLSEHDEEAGDESMPSVSDRGAGSSSGNKEGATTSTSSFSLARAETRVVMYSKALVLFVIVGFAIVIGIVVYKFVRKQEYDDYYTKFQALANELSEISQDQVKHLYSNLERLGVSLTAYALSTNQSWPFVVNPNFEVEGLLSNNATDVQVLTLNPIVPGKNLGEWTNFSVANQDWVAIGHNYDETIAKELYQKEYFENTYHYLEKNRWNNTGIIPYVWQYGNVTTGDDHQELPVDPAEFYTPNWQRVPAPDFHIDINLDLNSVGLFSEYIDAMIRLSRPVITAVTDATWLTTNYDHRFNPAELMEPYSYVLQPIYNNFTSDRQMVAFLSAFRRWGSYFKDVLRDSEQGIVVVLGSSCSSLEYTYVLWGPRVEYLGDGEVIDINLPRKAGIVEQDTKFVVAFEFAPWQTGDSNLCQFDARIFPSEQWMAKHFSRKPYFYAFGVVGCFVITTCVFIFYDVLVQKRQNKVMESAKRTNAVVASLFPANVRDRLLQEVSDGSENKNPRSANVFLNNGKKLGAGMTSEDIFGSKPIADLFPETTIMFADMVGFTAWSSVREPSQVFSLLETVYHSFDVIAKRRRVFKVETVGDCYVAVTGLPIPRKNHAVVMAKFANDCLVRMKELVLDLETSLGPDTADLSIRIGLHSGPVTAGVLRGDKGRFQLFGDTMNTASRMESTGLPGKIQVTRDTAELLIDAGKDKWVTQREDQVVAKGKGTLQTYFIKIYAESACTSSNMTNQSGESDEDGENESAAQKQKSLTLGPEMGASNDEPKGTFGSLPEKLQRMVTWNVDVLTKSLQQVIAYRASVGSLKAPSKPEMKKMTSQNSNALDEVQDVLALPQFNAEMVKNMVDPNSIQVPKEVTSQLADLVARIAAMHHHNHFHNFEHASHVTISVIKLLSRIINPNEVTTQNNTDEQIAVSLHDHTFGITSDPLTQFACVLAALVHDLDHPGVPNTTLVREKHPLAEKYCNKSVAEQNSVDLAWSAIMSPEYYDLRACIYGSKDEYDRFRAIVVNMVMATDIMDKDLGAARKARWTKAFADNFDTNEEERDAPSVAVNRKATIVLEHLMQASDVAHTMQHWHVYKKWNERLFCELYQAYTDGRSQADPSTWWYRGEMDFFDFYIIPLAKQLEICGVFGVTTHEYLSYALQNRIEWEEKGEELVKQYVENFKPRKKETQPWGVGS